MKLLVGNPSAQSGKNAARIARARVLLDGAGVDHAFVSTVAGGATVAVVSAALRDEAIDTVIAMGGDGTFAEVGKSVLASGRSEEVALAMLPTGTANDQGKSFGLSADEDALARNVEVIREGHETRLDVGAITALDEAGRTLREDLFFDSAGWGISPHVLAVRNEDRRLIEQMPGVRDVLRDHVVYAGALFRTFLASYVEDQKFDARVVADGEAHLYEGLTDLVIKGTRVYGGMWVFDPTAQHDDGLFEIIPFVGKRDWMSKAIVHLDGSGAFAENLAALGVEHSASLRAAKIELELRAHEVPIHGQIDGEEFPGSPRVRIEVRPRALRLVVPRDAS